MYILCANVYVDKIYIDIDPIVIYIYCIYIYDIAFYSFILRFSNLIYKKMCVYIHTYKIDTKRHFSKIKFSLPKNVIFFFIE